MIPGISTLLRMNMLTKDQAEAKKTYKSRVADIGEGFLAIEVPLDEETGKMVRWN
ncbi:flagellar brake domain-containing protein [Ammoniphilus resinae]|uniref:Uncharacterized protein n=1 Tax=Ammoniphilus resinae TaxID=861532 RepID=A0ABS4GT70_9BACL|nr:flagellar brake domain-containing protein [Ammoniphilus resinae]MBP1933480.1 hypothetical protein [Ammoniphilus resinae]